MDPNAALKTLREEAVHVLDDDSCADSLAETFVGLDEWLTKGGFAPVAWGGPTGTVDPKREVPEDEVKALVTIEAVERLVKRALRALAEEKDPAWARLLLTQVVDVTTARTCTAVKSLGLSDEISLKADDIVAKEVKIARRVQASEQGRSISAEEKA
jgi:hypothetical protein